MLWALFIKPRKGKGRAVASSFRQPETMCGATNSSFNYGTRQMKRISTLFTAFLLVGAFAAPAFAKEYSYPEMDQCFEQPEAQNGVTAAMLNCTNAEIDRQETRMNNVLAKLVAKHPKKAARLKKEQADWLRKMKRATRKEYTRTGGTMDLLNGSGLALDMITARAEALEQRLAR